MEFTDATVVPYGLLVMYSMDIYRQDTCPPKFVSQPPAPSGGGTLIGYVMGTDTVVIGHPSGGPLAGLSTAICYGTVIRRGPSEVVVALRGTDGYREWIEDGEFPAIPYQPANPLPAGSAGATVEQGFWGIYHSLTLTDPHGVAIGALAQSLPGLLGPADAVIVAGHSLGAPLATYLTLDLARGPLGKRVSGCFFASPYPGNQAFADLFDRFVGGDYVVYNYLLDLVPRVPIGLGYCALSRVKVIQPETAQAEIRLGIGCSHHVICYLAMLDFAAVKPYVDAPPAGEADSAACVKGPQTGKPNLAKSLVTRILDVGVRTAMV